MDAGRVINNIVDSVGYYRVEERHVPQCPISGDATALPTRSDHTKFGRSKSIRMGVGLSIEVPKILGTPRGRVDTIRA